MRCLRQRLRRRQQQALGNDDGDFALALFDSRQRQLFLACDVMGTRRLHYTRRNDTLLFASEIRSLLSEPGVAAVHDEDTIAEIVRIQVRESS